MEIAVLLYEGFDELDAIGPFEVFQTAGAFDADCEASLVTLAASRRVTASHGLRIEPHATLGDPDLVVVPGGGWNAGGAGARREVERGRIPEAVARLHAEQRTVASVCTGGMLLAHAGVLDGRPATTHASALEDLREFADVREARVVDTGDVLTAGGVTSGLDLALHVVRREFGDRVADRVVRELEYEPTRDVLVV